MHVFKYIFIREQLKDGDILKFYLACKRIFTLENWHHQFMVEVTEKSFCSELSVIFKDKCMQKKRKAGISLNLKLITWSHSQPFEVIFDFTNTL